MATKWAGEVVRCGPDAVRMEHLFAVVADYIIGLCVELLSADTNFFSFPNRWLESFFLDLVPGSIIIVVIKSYSF